MLTCFFDSHSIVHHKYAPEGQTINKEYYLRGFMLPLRCCAKKQTDMWTGMNWQLYLDNAPAHSALVSKVFCSKAIWHLCDSLLTLLIWHHVTSGVFSKLKTMLKMIQFQSCKNIMEKTMAELRSIPEEFIRCFQKWQRQWEKCVHLQGKYFEGD